MSRHTCSHTAFRRLSREEEEEEDEEVNNNGCVDPPDSICDADSVSVGNLDGNCVSVFVCNCNCGCDSISG